jgi:hypothetical protein
MKRNLPPCIIKVLINLYTHNFLRIAWDGFLTEYFSAVSGLKLGAALSPVLFCVYLKNLLIALSTDVLLVLLSSALLRTPMTLF